MARPSLSPQSRRNRTIAFRVTEAEFERLLARATETGQRVNDLARTLALARADHVRIEGCDRIDPALIKQLHYIGHNLNQLVKRFHMTGRVSPNIENLCLRIEDLIDKAIEQEIDS